VVAGELDGVDATLACGFGFALLGVLPLAGVVTLAGITTWDSGVVLTELATAYAAPPRNAAGIATRAILRARARMVVVLL
jgi:hypothetical protein